MHAFLAILSIGLVWLCPYAQAYGIDTSCQDQAWIEASVEAAKDMAAKALEAITPPNNAPRDANVERLLNLLFRPTGHSNAADDARLINSIKTVFQGVAKIGNKSPTLVGADGNIGTADQVNFYCNLDRVWKRTTDNLYYDTSAGVVLKDFDTHALNSCQTLKADLAVTWAPYSSEDRSSYLPSQITLCPWFYQWAHSQELKTWTELRVKSGLATMAIPAATNIWPFTPIDAIDLLDKVILHELTHTHACGALVDVKMAKDGAPGFNVGYGWKAATALAKQKDNTAQKTPTRNSDSFALFGSGIRLLNIAAPDGPVYIQDNGVTTTKRPSKRDVPRELQYKQTPVASPAFEGFLTKIRAEREAATAAWQA